MGAASVGNATSLVQIQDLGDKPVIIHFWASWCEPCKQMDAVMSQLASELPNIAFLRVEAEAVDDATMHYEVTTVPSFVFIKGGSVVDRLEGADPPVLTSKATALAGGAAAAASSAPAMAAPAAAPAPAVPEVFGRIKFMLAQWPVVVFMKGTEAAPQCGFSGRVVDALHKLEVAFKSVDILRDEALRQGLKQYSNWPTYPQLYVKGELVGGCDIVTELAASGELEAMLKEKLGPDYKQVAAAAVMSSAPAEAGPPSAAPAEPAPAPLVAGGGASEASPASTSGGDVLARIKGLLASSPVLLFMKGSPEAPRCGFSRKVAEALKEEGLEFGSFDILQDEAVRQGLKEYSNWPTYPQLYVRGELVGGCDIVLELKSSGELGSSIREMLHRMDVAT